MLLRLKTTVLLLITVCSVSGVTGLNKTGKGGDYRSKTTMDKSCRQTLKPTRARRIVGGSDSTPGAWPWYAALYKEGEFKCGATLISSRFLLSAAHCFHQTQDLHWVAKLGAFHREMNLHSLDKQVRVISHIVVHPKYIRMNHLVNDISILRMEKPVRFTDYIKPICLPPPTTEIRDGRMCTAVGMGTLQESDPVLHPKTLPQIQVPLISTEDCISHSQYFLTNSQFCAGFHQGERDTCFGDSGGPLMCEETDGRWILFGITNGGDGCARHPTVFAKVANFVPWIDQVVNETYENTSRSSR